MKLLQWGLTLALTTTTYGWEKVNYNSYSFTNREVSTTARVIARELGNYELPHNVRFRVLSDKEYSTLEETLNHHNSTALTIPVRHRKTKEFMGWDIVIRDNRERNGKYAGGIITLGEAIERALHEIQHVRNMQESGLLIKEPNRPEGEQKAIDFEDKMEKKLRQYGIILR